MNNRLFSRLFILMTGIMAITVVWVWLPGSRPKHAWSDPLNYFRLASGLWFACYLAMIMGGATRFPAWFHGQASYSYTLYVIHFPIMLFILGVSQLYIYGSLPRSLAISALTIALSIAAAKLIARFAEDKDALRGVTASLNRMIVRK
ncbi:hypothetical protein SAMN05216601_10958 [Ectopseudomonas composti]|uniref:Acyltransferase family protein n=1 Tax=Ectopseudomonas composti TaxID=658457 RepID=A0A1I5PFZ0_9GAMM|nr:hypothetical protein [Pseudomonas composti]SFP32979.1 hypothetical protein SAMN05216601_10958 [Pseudomonas composti]